MREFWSIRMKRSDQKLEEVVAGEEYRPKRQIAVQNLVTSAAVGVAVVQVEHLIDLNLDGMIEAVEGEEAAELAEADVDSPQHENLIGVE